METPQGKRPDLLEMSSCGKTSTYCPTSQAHRLAVPTSVHYPGSSVAVHAELRRARRECTDADRVKREFRGCSADPCQKMMRHSVDNASGR